MAELAKAPKAPEEIYGKLVEFLALAKPEFESVKASGVDVTRFQALLLRAVKTPKIRWTEQGEVIDWPLLNCTPQSLKDTLCDSLALGLPIGGQMAFGYAVPRKGKASFQIGYQGLLRLIQNECKAAPYARAVCVNDDFSYDQGIPPRVSHNYPMPTDGGKEFDRGIVVAYWSAIGFNDRPWLLEVETIDRLDAHAKQYVPQDRSGRFFKDALICTNPDIWYKKTMLRRVCKFAPISEIAHRVLQAEEYSEQNVGDEPESFESGSEQTTDDIREVVKGAAPLSPGNDLGRQMQ